jgi:hypothetical protein
MRKTVMAALLLIALGCITGVSTAWADCGKCGGCQDKCNTCKSSCNKCDKCDKGCGHKKKGCCTDCCARTPCADWGGGEWWSGDACCAPESRPIEVCIGESCGCHHYKHPYEQVWNGTGMLCDTGCAAFLPCKRKGIICTTTCSEHKTTDCCGCEHVSYCPETTCTEVTRPRTIPWWFNPKGDGNTYLDENGKPLGGEAADSAADGSGWAAEAAAPGAQG